MLGYSLLRDALDERYQRYFELVLLALISVFDIAHPSELFGLFTKQQGSNRQNSDPIT